MLLVILGLAYMYLNMSNNFNIQQGGAREINPACIPLTYRFRYLFYFGMIFAIVFAISMGVSASSINNMTYGDYIKTGLNQFATDSVNIKTLPQNNPNEYQAYQDLLKSCSGLNQNAVYAGAFCRIVAPCSCCNEPGYYNVNCPSGSPGSIIPTSPSPSNK
jgi:hypothetical protein